MNEYNWCHGTNCHTIQTQSRVRGSGDNKVLRTRKVKVYTGRSMYGNGGGTIWDYFCNHSCLMDYLSQHTQAVINIAPRTKPLETPITVKKEKYDTQRYQYTDNGYQPYDVVATRTKIESK